MINLYKIILFKKGHQTLDILLDNVNLSRGSFLLYHTYREVHTYGQVLEKKAPKKTRFFANKGSIMEVLSKKGSTKAVLLLINSL